MICDAAVLKQVPLFSRLDDDEAVRLWGCLLPPASRAHFFGDQMPSTRLTVTISPT